jgi:DNA-binding MarR family transcriptional regulator
MGSPPDKIGDVVSGWHAVLPGLDPSALELVGRALVLARHLERTANAALAKHDLSLGEFDILGTLRRRGDGGMTPTQLLEWIVLTSGGLTARLTRLEARGLITRTPDPADRRGVVVQLTAKGRRLTDAAAATRFAEAEKSLPALTEVEQKTLKRLLKKWLETVE